MIVHRPDFDAKLRKVMADAARAALALRNAPPAYHAIRRRLVIEEACRRLLSCARACERGRRETLDYEEREELKLCAELCRDRFNSLRRKYPRS